MKRNGSIVSMYAVTPCHAGSGSSTGVVDLPIQRERHTNWPIIQASGLKGAMRAHFERYKGALEADVEGEQFKQLTELIFGSENHDYAGSLSVGDAKILAYPMRSNFAPFVWITCPSVLARLNRDLLLAEKEPLDLDDLKELTSAEKAFWVQGNFKEGANILLEDMEVVAEKQIQLEGEVTCFKEAERLLVVSDEVFSYGVSHCTSVMAQIKIDQTTGTTQDGSLRYQEELPADTLMYSLTFWGDSRDDQNSFQSDMIKGFITEKVIGAHLQVGGDETLGRGIFALQWL